jgi:hypothetical protein
MGEDLELRVPTAAAWAGIVAQARAHGGVMFGHLGHRAFRAFDDVAIRFLGPEGELCRVVGRVVRLTADQVAFTFDADAVAAIAAAWRDEEAPAPPSPGEPAPPAYEQLSKAERIKLARLGNADARRRVLRDRDRTLHVHVLSNPGLSGAELAALIRGGNVSGEFQQEVARREDLMRHPEVVEALVRSPRTPIHLAVALVPRVPIEVARQIARTASLRDPVVAAARHRVIGNR